MVTCTKATADPKGTVLKCIRRLKGRCRVKERPPPAAFDPADWGGAEGATSAHPDLLNIWTMKQVSGFCPAGKAMK